MSNEPKYTLHIPSESDWEIIIGSRDVIVIRPNDSFKPPHRLARWLLSKLMCIHIVKWR